MATEGANFSKDNNNQGAGTIEDKVDIQIQKVLLMLLFFIILLINTLEVEYLFSSSEACGYSLYALTLHVL